MTGKNILQYELLEKLGAGGMGEIFKARDTRLNRFVAIKILPSAASADMDRRRRFIQEAQAASALNHPNIITIYDIIDHEGTQMMVMEYIAGKTLLEVIPRGGLRVPLVLQYSTQVADALGAAHAAGIIHRDLKPANIMITGTSLVKLLDFGLAKLSEPAPMATSGETATLLSSPLTVEGAVMGTVNYMSPEQAEGKKVDARSDIFSFGSVLYEMTTGNCAFNGASSISTLSAVLRDEVRAIAEIAPDVPAPLEQIITRCLQKDPDHRWQSMKEVHAALTALRRQSDSGVLYKSQMAVPAPPIAAAPTIAAAAPVATAPPVAAAPPAPKKGSSAALVIAAVVLVVLVLAALGIGGWWWFARFRHPVPAPVSAVTVAPAAPAAGAQEPGAAVPAAVTPPAVPQTPSASSKRSALPPSASASSAPAPVAPAPSAAAGRPAASRGTPVAVADGLPFRITLAEDIPASPEEGSTVRFTVSEPLRVGGAVVIAQGTVVTGAIIDVGKKKFFGMGANKLNLRLIQADGVDGRKLAVRATSVRPPDGPARRPVNTGRASKVKDVAAARGTEYIGYIDGAQTVLVRR